MSASPWRLAGETRGKAPSDVKCYIHFNIEQSVEYGYVASPPIAVALHYYIALSCMQPNIARNRLQHFFYACIYEFIAAWGLT